MPQAQGAGTVYTGGPGSAQRTPWYAKIFTGIGGAINFQKIADQIAGVMFLYCSTVDNLTALAGGGQAGATAITAQITRFATVATAGDSSILPASAAGLEITVINAGAASMNVFPATGDKINALSANSAFAIASGKTATFFCATAGQWHSILSA